MLGHLKPERKASERKEATKNSPFSEEQRVKIPRKVEILVVCGASASETTARVLVCGRRVAGGAMRTACERRARWLST